MPFYILLKGGHAWVDQLHVQEIRNMDFFRTGKYVLSEFSHTGMNQPYKSYSNCVWGKKVLFHVTESRYCIEVTATIRRLCGARHSTFAYGPKIVEVKCSDIELKEIERFHGAKWNYRYT